MKGCSVASCASPFFALGFCRPHYMSFRRIGKPIADRQTIHGPIEKKFAIKSKGRNEKGCWIWSGRKDKNGYGSLRDGHKMKRAHRVAWEIHKGPIPAGVMVLHKCNNPSCVNPSHLKLGDQTANMQDRKENGKPWISQQHRETMSKVMKGRKITWIAKIAEKARKLTVDQATNIKTRLAAGEKVKDLAAEYGLHRTTISKIKMNTYFIHHP